MTRSFAACWTSVRCSAETKDSAYTLYTSSVPDGRAANHAFFVVTLRPPMDAPLPGASVRRPVISSPARVVAATCSGRSLASAAFCSRDAGASTRAYQERPKRSTSPPCSCDGEWPVRAMISAASRASRMPSLSVVHTVPSWRRKDAPADSSPPNPTDPSSRPGTNHLKPTGTSRSRRPWCAATRSMSAEETRVLPTAASGDQPSRCPPYR